MDATLAGAGSRRLLRYHDHTQGPSCRDGVGLDRLRCQRLDYHLLQRAPRYQSRNRVLLAQIFEQIGAEDRAAGLANGLLEKYLGLEDTVSALVLGTEWAKV